MTTRAEAIARARTNIQPGIDASLAQVDTLNTLVNERVAAVYQLPGVVAAQAQLDTWTQTLSERINTGLQAPGVQNPIANLQTAQETLRTRQNNLAARLAAINAYYDELERRAVTAPIVDQPPAEAA